MEISPHVVILTMWVEHIEAFCLIITKPLGINFYVHFCSDCISPIKVLGTVGRGTFSIR